MSTPKASQGGWSGLDHVERLTCLIMVLMMSVLVVGVNLQVFDRFFLGSSFSWTQELVQYAFVWMTFIGAGVGVRRNLHLRINLLDSNFGQQGRRNLRITVDLLCLILAVLFVVGGTIVAWRTKYHFSPTMGLPIACLYAVFPVSGLGLIAFLVEAIVHGRPVDETNAS